MANYNSSGPNIIGEQSMNMSNIVKETEQIINKMKRITISKKHNYKNIKELDNIYDTNIENIANKNAILSGREAVGYQENSGERSSQEFYRYME